MREIKFRAISYKTNEFIYGYLWKKKYNTEKMFISHFPNKDDDEYKDVVKSETLGQYTGLKDKNGVAIYEGDIYRFQFMQELYKGVIVYKEELARFVIELEDLAGKWCEFPSQTDDVDYFCEIVGNIHEEKINER